MVEGVSRETFLVGDTTNQTRNRLRKECDYRVVAWFIPYPKLKEYTEYEGRPEEGRKDDLGRKNDEKERTWLRVPDAIKQTAKSWFK